MLVVGGFGCAQPGEGVMSTSAALSTPAVLRQEQSFPPANGVVQGGPEWLGRCGATSFAIAGDITTGYEPHRLEEDGGVTLIRDLIPVHDSP
jgi:hypothetical protein